MHTDGPTHSVRPAHSWRASALAACCALACGTGETRRDVWGSGSTARATPSPSDADACAEPLDGDTVDSLARAFEEHFRVGVALSSSTFDGTDAAAEALVSEHFSRISPENVLKWSSVHPSPDRYAFEPVDRFVAFGERHGMEMHGHVLVWHQQVPDWVFSDDRGAELSAPALWERLEEHIGALAERYGSSFAYWDVVNEAFLDNGELRDSPWRRILGDDYLAEVFALADRLLPEAKLIYNDYSMFLPPKHEAVIRMVRDLRSRGVRIDAVGMQGHYNLMRPRIDEVETVLAAFEAADIEVLVTELDLDVLPSERQIQGADLDDRQDASALLNPYTRCLPPDVDAAIAEHWGKLFEVFVAHSHNISSITFWGVSDRHTWLNDWPINGRTNYPLLFDRNLHPKRSFEAVIQRAKP